MLRWRRSLRDALRSATSTAGAGGDDDRGSASLELITAGLLLLVPLVYLVVAVSQVESAAFAVEGAARHTARVVARDGSAAGLSLAAASVDATLDDFGLDRTALHTRIDCAPDPRECERPGTIVTVTMRLDVPLPLVPPWLHGAVPLVIPVEASASARASDFAARP